MTQKYLLKKTLLKYIGIITEKKVLFIEANSNKEFAMLILK